MSPLIRTCWYQSPKTFCSFLTVNPSCTPAWPSSSAWRAAAAAAAEFDAPPPAAARCAAGVGAVPTAPDSAPLSANSASLTAAPSCFSCSTTFWKSAEERTSGVDGSEGDGTETAAADGSELEVTTRVEAASEGGSESGEAAVGARRRNRGQSGSVGIMRWAPEPECGRPGQG